MVCITIPRIRRLDIDIQIHTHTCTHTHTHTHSGVIVTRETRNMPTCIWIFSKNGTGSTIHIYIYIWKENNYKPYFTQYTETNSRGIIALSVKAKTIKHLE